MVQQPAQPENEQSDEAGEEPNPESLIDDPEFYRGGIANIMPVSSDVVPGDEPYLIRNRARAMQNWAQDGAPVKGICIVALVVGGVLIAVRLLFA